MHDVSNAINILDPSKSIDGKICGAGSTNWVKNDGGSDNPGKEEAGKCGSTIKNGGTESNFKQLSHMFTPPTGQEGQHTYKDTATNKMGEHTSAKISKDVSALHREQKGVVSSAFAKAHEGAEMVEIRSISTTSVMVNACYDVLTDGLPVSLRNYTAAYT